MSERLVRLDQLAIGLTPDLPDQTPSLWEDGRNVLFVDKELQPLPGQIPLVKTGLKINAMNRTGDSVFLGTNTSVLVYSISQAKIYNVTPAGDTSTGPWSFVAYGTWIIGSHGGKVYIWKPGEEGENPPQFSLISDAPTGVVFLLKFKNYVLAVGKEYVYWCDDDNPELWTPEQDNQAGSLFIRDCQGDIIGGVANDDIALICTQKEVIKLNYLSTPYIFGYKKIFEGAGIWNHKSITIVNNTVFGFGPNGIWCSNGSSFSYIDKGKVSDTISTNMNISLAEQCFVGAWNILQHVFIFVPQMSGQILCFGFNMVNNLWTLLNWDRACAYREYWCDNDGVLYIDDLKSAANLSEGDGILTLGENITGGLGFGYGKIEQSSYGGVLWFQG